jgi:hypothetical protein
MSEAEREAQAPCRSCPRRSRYGAGASSIQIPDPQPRTPVRGCRILLLVACVGVWGCGGSSPSAPAAVAPSPVASRPAAPSSVASPSIAASPAPSIGESDAGEGFQLPNPVCPAPAVAASAPRVQVTNGAGESIVATEGSSTMSTCSTSSVTDTVGTDPEVGLIVRRDDVLTLEVAPGWSILAYEAYDRAASEESANVTPVVVLPSPAATIRLPVPPRKGRSIVGVTLSVVSASGQVVGQVGARFQVQVG